MSTRTEMKEEKMKTNNQLVESNFPKQLPSIWYS